MGSWDDDRQTQLDSVLQCASRLVKEGFLEPAYRLELYWLVNQAETQKSARRARVKPGVPSEEIYATLEDLTELPRTFHQSLLIGASDMGKSDALRKIAAHWCLGGSAESGKSHPTWLPIQVEEGFSSATDVSTFFKTPAASDTGLRAHQQIAKIVGPQRLPWLFPSPLLYR